MTKIIAHCGYSGNAPENTMYAFQKAVDCGADAIETDVRKTADGKIIIIHDRTLKRLAGDQYADWDVTQKTYDEIKDVDISTKDFPDIPAQHIVLLSELLELVKKSGIELNIELKGNSLIDDGLEYDVAKMVMEYSLEDKIFYSCFDHPMLVNILKAYPNAKIAPLYSSAMYRAGDYAKSFGAFAVHPYYKPNLLRGDFEAIRRAGVEINVWTVNDPEDAKKLVKAGVTGIITDYPDIIARAVADM